MKLYTQLTLLLITLLATACTSLSEEGQTAVVSNLGGTHFYSLSSLAPANNPQSTLRIGVGPVQIPRLLTRPQIISRKNSNEIIMAERHQWGGSLREEITQTMTDNLSTLLKTDHIEQYPWKFAFKPHYQVRINIERLDGKVGKNVILKARWRLLKNNKEVLSKHALINTPARGKSYGRYVKAQSKALEIFSQQIAGKIASFKK
ncbi:MAG: membrane integrity-associated transporter subunit PqiC [Cocleimonas sp.]|nr:membrane integrity-associated transporter subunit PqiC [Cocleimonas sp.]